MSHSLPLTRGYTALVDDSDYDLLSQSKWLYVGSGYAGRFISHKKLLYLHRFILDAQPGQRVDHINADRLDCRRENLRLVTLCQNQQNRHTPANTTSGLKGVCWHKGTGQWHVRITVNGQRLHLGYYQDAQTAAQLYDAAARHFFGEYACPNFPAQPTSPAIALLLSQVLHRRASRMESYDIKPACGGRCALCQGEHSAQARPTL